MNKDVGYKDVRVPTFIPYDLDDSKKLKRKRTTQNNKRKSKKINSDDLVDGFEVADVKKRKKTQENEAWVGAAIEGKNGAYSVFYGENDQRNFSEVYTKENELQGLEYAYVLGTLKAIECLESSDVPFTVNTTCRDLQRAIAGRAKNFHYKDLSDKIREALKGKEQDIQVRHASGRTSSSQHKTAAKLAKDTLRQYLEPEIVSEESKVVEEKKTLTETVIEEPAFVLEEKKTVIEELALVLEEKEAMTETDIEEPALVLEERTKELEPVLIDNENDSNEFIEEKQVSSLVVEEGDQVITTTTVTTITSEIEVETTIIETELENNNDMEIDQEEKEVAESAPSTWTSVFGIRNLLDILYAPFRTRKST